MKSFEVGRLGFGTARIAAKKNPDGSMSPVYGNEVAEQKIIQDYIYLANLNGSLAHIDTAESYGAGHTEEVVGVAISKIRRSKLIIASKIGLTPQTADQIVAATEGCLRRLNLSQLDVLYLHNMPKTDDQIIEAVRGLSLTVKKGLTKKIGVSNFNVEGLQLALSKTSEPIVAHQARYNLESHGLFTEEMLDLCRKNNILIVAHTPLGRGQLGKDCHNQTVIQMSQKYDVAPAQIAIAWLHRQDSVLAIPRTHDIKHMRQNFEALHLDLYQKDVDQLSTLGVGK